MRYFQKFPTFPYSLTEYVQGASAQKIVRVVPNMTVKLKMDIFAAPNIEYFTYRIEDKDRVDTIAAQMYGSTEYAWLILLANNMRDWYDWPLTELEFNEYIREKYESSSGMGDGLERSAVLISAYRWNFIEGNTTFSVTVSSSMGGVDLPANGTCTVATENTTVTGINTAFDSVISGAVLTAGCLIAVGNTSLVSAQYRAVQSVINATALTVTEPFTTSATNTSYRLLTDLPAQFSLSGIEKITKYEEEAADNDKKREIRLPTPSALSVISAELNNLLGAS